MDVLPAGTLLHQDRFLIQRMLGRGGFGITYEALDQQTGRTVALKEFFPLGSIRQANGQTSGAVQPGTGQPGTVQPGGLLTAESFANARAQFLESAAVLSRLRHPGIVRVYEFWEANGTACMVMERLQGHTLLDMVEECGAIPPAAALHIVEQLGEALAAIHRLDLLHLDIKPENVMVCTKPHGVATAQANAPSPAPNLRPAPNLWQIDESTRIVLFDFDLMQRLESAGGYRTRPLIPHTGTPGYAALEQYTEHGTFGRFTDIYALGATLYHLLTGFAPPAATDRAHDETGTLWKAARQVLPELDEKIDEAINWALEMPSRQRPPETTEWLHALRHGRPHQMPDSDNRHPSPDTVAPTMPVLPNLPQVDGWFRLALTDLEVDWPQQCACCLHVPSTVIDVKVQSQHWAIPYCYRCSRHLQAANQAVTFTTAGMIVGLVIALTGFMLANIFLSPLGVIIHFSAMAYGALKVQATEAIMRPTCCDRKIAVAYGGQRGPWHYVHFKNLTYANDFKKLNEEKVKP